MSDHFDHMNDALDGLWDGSYNDEPRYVVRIVRCKYCKKKIDFLGKMVLDKGTTRRHECDFSELLNAGD